MHRFILFISILFLITSCQKEQKISIPASSTSASSQLSADQNHNPYFCNSPSEAEAGQIYNHEGKIWLWGGREEQQDFNISGWSLQVQNLGSGLGRELIKALTFPVYKKASKQKIKDDAKVIVVKGAQETRVYTYDLLTKHELVNDIIDGQSILVAYCPLADLGVVYKRTYCDTELFFALSGYTYIEKNEKAGRNNSAENTDIESFILWDRNTESLWYPLRNRAVSGKMHNQKMLYYDRYKWELTTYSKALEKYGQEVEVLSYQQTLDLNKDWDDNLNQSVQCN